MTTYTSEDYQHCISFHATRNGKPIRISLWNTADGDHTLLTIDYNNGKGHIPVAQGPYTTLYVEGTDYISFRGQVVGTEAGFCPTLTEGFTLSLNNTHVLNMEIRNPQGILLQDRSVGSQHARVDYAAPKEGPNFQEYLIATRKSQTLVAQSA